MGRIRYLKLHLINLACWMVLSFVVLMAFASKSLVLSGLMGMCAVVLGFALFIQLMKITYNRLTDVFPGRDGIMLMGLYLIGCVLTGGLLALALYVLPSNLVAKHQ